jgi:hypothetical protein
LRNRKGARCRKYGTNARESDVGDFHFHMLLDRKP